jgi:hypothetical protein
MIPVLRKIRFLLTPAERRGALILLGLMVVGMTLEMLCTGLVIPAIALMMQQDLAKTYPQFQPLLAALGTPTQTELILNVMLGLVGIYLIKNLFLAFLAWRQTRYAFGVQVQLSQGHRIPAPAVHLPPAAQLRATDPQRHRGRCCVH